MMGRELDVIGGEAHETEYAFEDEVSCEELLCSRLAILKDRKNTVTAAICFLIVGLVFAGLFFYFLVEDSFGRAVPFGIIALLMGLPGGYACGLIVQALANVQGYTIESLPSYDLE